MQRAIGSLFRSLRPSSPEALLSAASPHVLFAADAPELRERLAEWQVVTDADIGGTSKASFELVHLDDGGDGGADGGVAGRFSGSLVKPAAGVRGFCALKSPTWTPPRELGEVHSIEVRARANGAEARRFLLNLNLNKCRNDWNSPRKLKRSFRNWQRMQQSNSHSMAARYRIGTVLSAGG